MSCVLEAFWIHIQEAEVLSVRFPKEYGHINLAAKQSIPSCVLISFKTMFICDFLIHCIHTYIHACIHAHLLVDCTFPKICIYYAYIYTYICVSCAILMFSRIHIPEAEVLSVRFPEEYDHINLAAKHPKLWAYFNQYFVYLWFFHTYIHAYTLFCFDSLFFAKDTYIYNIYIHTLHLYIYIQ